MALSNSGPEPETQACPDAVDLAPRGLCLGAASGGLTIALAALGQTSMQLAGELGIDPSLMHRVAVIGAGTLDSLPHNGAVVTLLAVCRTTTRRVISIW